jgi:hypothetical protein
VSEVTTVCFIAVFVNKYYDRLLPLLRQFLLIPNRISKFMDLRNDCLTSCLTLRLLMSYIYMERLFLIFLDHTHNDAPQSVGLLWTSDQLVAETSTWQHTTLTTNKYPCPWWDSNPLSQQVSGRRPLTWSVKGGRSTENLELIMPFHSFTVLRN